MIRLERIETYGWEAAIRGMRNPYNSWPASDTEITPRLGVVNLGENDQKLMLKLVKAGPVHSKFLRMITVTLDITAPLYWWKEFDTYKVGTVANSCSTMHTLHKRDLTREDFSCEHLSKASLRVLDATIKHINTCRVRYVRTNSKDLWWQMIQLLPSSFNQRRTVQLNYEVIKNIYQYRKDHKQDEWRNFCAYLVMALPYPDLFGGEDGVTGES